MSAQWWAAVGSVVVLVITTVVFCGDNLGWWTLRKRDRDE